VAMTQYCTYLDIHCHKCSLLEEVKDFIIASNMRRSSCGVVYPEEVFLIHFRSLFPRFNEANAEKRHEFILNQSKTKIFLDIKTKEVDGGGKKRQFDFGNSTLEHIWFYNNLVEPELIRRCRQYNICYSFNSSIWISLYYNRSF
jgi:hypothetical protein